MTWNFLDTSRLCVNLVAFTGCYFVAPNVLSLYKRTAYLPTIAKWKSRRHFCCRAYRSSVAVNIAVRNHGKSPVDELLVHQTPARDRRCRSSGGKIKASLHLAAANLARPWSSSVSSSIYIYKIYKERERGREREREKECYPAISRSAQRLLIDSADRMVRGTLTLLGKP